MSEAILHARLDAAGALVEADEAFAALNTRAGGALGRPLAVPQLATIAHLARRLGILVSRAATVADGAHDLDLWVRAQPADGGVRLSLSTLGERPAARPGGGDAADFVAAAADWTWESDGALRLTRVSLDAGARHGFDAAAMLGAPLTRLFALDGGDDGALPLLEAVAARADFDGQPATLRDTGAAVILAAVARRDAAGGFAGFVGGSRMVAPAPAAPGMPAAFATRLDRVLRAPLAAIIANADSINARTDGPLGDDYAGYAADIASAGRHLLALVDDLADIEAIERDDFAPAAEDIDLADLARRAAGLFAVRAADAEVTLDRPGPRETAPASGEFRRALQVLVNLIGNAVRYAPRGSTVNVIAARDGGRSAVIVGDQGPGIAPVDHERIFDKFARLDMGEAGGNGLGLYIARRLARAMGGDLTVDSAPGNGARFVFTLPSR